MERGEDLEGRSYGSSTFDVVFEELANEGLTGTLKGEEARSASELFLKLVV